MAFARHVGHDPLWVRELDLLPELRRLGRETRRRTGELLDRVTPAVAQAIAVTERGTRRTLGRVRTMNIPAQILERMPRLPARRPEPPRLPGGDESPAAAGPGVGTAGPAAHGAVAEPVTPSRTSGAVVSGRTWATGLSEGALNWMIAIACLALLIVGLRAVVTVMAEVVQFIQETVNTFFERFDYPTPL
ncbi:MAG: hypothetical protein DIU67_011090 [Actinomycetes bacterium]|jgi:hypothetical protein|nr:MAG: hypothetical protein DIU67_08035 [Actinomycetota bacterium]